MATQHIVPSVVQRQKSAVSIPIPDTQEIPPVEKTGPGPVLVFRKPTRRKPAFKRARKSLRVERYTIAGAFDFFAHRFAEMLHCAARQIEPERRRKGPHR